MARLIGRLTELQVRRLGTGWHNDGGGLYLRAEGKEPRWWVFRYGAGGKPYTGLGPVHTHWAGCRRREARRCRAAPARRGRPDFGRQGEARRGQACRGRRQDASSNAPKPIMRLIAPSWSNRKHSKEWLSSLATHVFPAIGGLPVRDRHRPVVRVLEPAWTKFRRPPRACVAASSKSSTGRAARLSAGWRQSGALERPSRSSPARSQAGCAGRAPQGALLPQRCSFRPQAAGARRDRGARARICPPDGGAGGRSLRRRLGGNRSCRRCLDRSRRAHEGTARAPRPARACRLRHPRTDAARAPAWLIFPMAPGGGKRFRHWSMAAAQELTGAGRRTRAAFDVPRLGRRADQLSARIRRARSRPCRRHRRRASLPTRRHAGEAPAADGGLGEILHERSGRIRRA